MTDTSEVVIARFWQRVRKQHGDGCWEWTGATDTSGYGRMRAGNKLVSCHRFVFEMMCGVIPEGLYVCHRCDNRICVRPAHLFAGTPAENNRDRDLKGRRVDTLGEINRHAKLTADQVIQIRRLCSERDMTQVQIAAQFGVSDKTVSAIARRYSWRHLKEAQDAASS